MERTVVVLEKPLMRVALPDWYGKVLELRQTSDARRNDALRLRNEATQLRNETDAKTYWDTYHNNARLADRLVEISKWREVLNACRRGVVEEMGELRQEKDLLEEEGQFLDVNFTVVNESLTQRDQRGGADLCADEADVELKHELKTLEGLKVMFTEKCQTAWEELNRLEELKFKLDRDIADKDETINLDSNNLGLDKNSAGLSYKPNCLAIPENMVSYERWVEHCRYLKVLADSELATSRRTREAMAVPRRRARNDLKAQNDTTNFALRKRIYETKRLKNELDWQRLNMVGAMDKLKREVERLETALASKRSSLELAESRCEARLSRPGGECCRDEAAFGLSEEVGRLRLSRLALLQKLEDAKSTYNSLEDQLELLDRELFNKNHALETDVRCLDLRNRLKTGDREPPNTQTDRNIIMNKMEDELPPE